MESICEIKKSIFSFLDSLQISYRVMTHRPLFTCEEAIKHRSNTRGSGCKNLFVRNKKGNDHYLIIAKPDTRIDLKSIKKEINASALSFASDKRLDKYLKTKKGSVSPFGLIFDANKSVIVIIEKSLMEEPFLNFHPNINTETVEIQPEGFRKFLSAVGNKVFFESFPTLGSES